MKAKSKKDEQALRNKRESLKDIKNPWKRYLRAKDLGIDDPAFIPQIDSNLLPRDGPHIEDSLIIAILSESQELGKVQDVEDVGYKYLEDEAQSYEEYVKKILNGD